MDKQRYSHKKISQNKITGQQGVNFVEQIVLEMGYAWHPTNESLEAGIDGIIEVRDPETGEATNNIIQVQVKATSKQWVSETTETFTYRCKPQDIYYWLNGNTPVILVAVSPNKREAYWVNVKAYFADIKKQRDKRVVFDKSTQKFTSSAALDLLKIAVPRDIGPYLPATEHTETLYSNLLKVKEFPPYIYSASTEYRNHEDIFEWEKKNDVNLPSGWLLTEKMIRCVHDLREEPWTQICDRGSVEQFDIDEWSNSEDPDKQREFVRLMNQTFRYDMSLRGLWYSSKEKCFYFPAFMNKNNEIEPRNYNYKSLLKWTSRDVIYVRKNRETKNIVYCRHSAMKYAFLNINNLWYLSIIPHYLYTTDGKNTYPYSEDLLSGIKRLERQGAAFGQTLMWKYKLKYKPKETLFDTEKPKYPLIVFDQILEAQCERGIPDKDWIKNDVVIKNADEEWGLF